MIKIYRLFVVIALSSFSVNSQTIYDVAGGNGGGFGGDGGSATSAQLGLIQNGVAFDAAGNIYIPDMNNQRVRKVDAVTGIITTIAGTGNPGYNGDSILAVSAQLNYPSCVVLDGAGNIYIGEYSGCRIRKVDAATGMISTISGTGVYGYGGDSVPAVSCANKEIGSLLLDSVGNIYFSDMGNAIIRKITLSTGIVKTIAGTANVTGFSGDGGLATSAKLNSPYAIAQGPGGHIYIADRLNNRIRKVNVSTGLISTVAGTNNSSTTYNGDSILADTANINFPWGVAVDANGNIYIADTENHRIRKVNTSGIISTICGNGNSVSFGNGVPAITAGLSRPFGVSVDACGAVYICEYGSDYSVRKISSFDVAVASTNASCSGICDGSINLTVSGGSGSFSYSWSGGLGASANQSFLCSGIYTVTVTDSNACGSTANITITQPPAISVSLTALSSSTCLNDGSAGSSVSGGAAPYTYLWSNGDTTSNADSLSPGTCSLTVTDASGCVATQTLGIISNTISVIFSNTNASCQGNGVASASVAGGTPPYTYSWSNGSTSSSATGLSAGSYSLTVTDANGCTTMQTGTINNDSLIFASAPICMVTVDSVSQYNIIVWDKTSFTNVDSFIVYREISTNNYQRIHSQAFSDLSQFVDTVASLYFPNTGNPNTGTYRYKIQTLDTCGMYGTLSPYHNTIYILNSSGTFYWTQLYTIENGANPVNNYVLMRDDSSNGNWQVVTSVSGTQQTINDPLYAIYQNTASWRVQTQWGISCTPTLKLQTNNTASNLNTSFSNIYTNSAVSIKTIPADAEVSIFPNPSDGKFNLQYDQKDKHSNVEIYNMRGQKVFSLTNLSSKTAEVDLSSQPAGVYFLNLRIEDKLFTKKIIIH